VGSGSTYHGVPGAAEFAYPVASLEAAERLRSILDVAPATAALTVVGAGPQGIETAAELAELGRTVTLVCGGVRGPYLHRRGHRGRNIGVVAAARRQLEHVYYALRDHQVPALHAGPPATPTAA
jgi:NADH:ubiquinone reductase (H+-translocating)